MFSGCQVCVPECTNLKCRWKNFIASGIGKISFPGGCQRCRVTWWRKVTKVVDCMCRVVQQLFFLATCESHIGCDLSHSTIIRESWDSWKSLLQRIVIPPKNVEIFV
jgi:hypothetical protein